MSGGSSGVIPSLQLTGVTNPDLEDVGEYSIDENSTVTSPTNKPKLFSQSADRRSRRTKSMGGSKDCEFPLFRQKFWGAAAWTENYFPDDIQSSSRYLQHSYSAHIQDQIQGKQTSRGKHPVFQLDLANIERGDEAPLTEVRQRQIKFDLYKNECSQVSQDLFISGESVARDRAILQTNKITHIINCVGYEFQNHFPEDIEYLTLYLYDLPSVDIKCVLYDCFDFIETARAKKGRILVHCEKGVSRSAAVVIGYLMWKLDRKYQDVFDDVKAIRGIANPNMGFFTQLMQLHKRWTQPVEQGTCRAYRIAPHNPSDAMHLVPKSLAPQSYENQPFIIEFDKLDTRIACIFHCSDCVYLWQGSDATEEFVLGAKQFAKQLEKYENAAKDPVRVFQGLEPPELLNVVRLWGQGFGQGQGQKQGQEITPSTVSHTFEQEFEWYTEAKLKQAQAQLSVEFQSSNRNYRFGDQSEGVRTSRSGMRTVRRGGSELGQRTAQVGMTHATNGNSNIGGGAMFTSRGQTRRKSLRDVDR
eukprot:TRINITY_DN3351_c0_g2_i1.p1 TRINITY_DN3351_c0_g2~~TRINITY_DN3351_c0_g2_i1.p1  ORF type:complete len:529 (+),score=63.10 TRINITY_DN3351_c0_g2_i1:520-2106(+)